MFTRTIVDAVVEYVIIAKVEGEIVTERKTQQIEKCSSKEKAELVLSKQNKGALIDLKSIKDNLRTGRSRFFQHSKSAQN